MFGISNCRFCYALRANPEVALVQVVQSCWAAYTDSEDRRAATSFALCAALLQPALFYVDDDSDPRQTPAPPSSRAFAVEACPSTQMM